MFWLLLLLTQAARIVDKNFVSQRREVRVESMTATDVRFIIRTCIFENLRNTEVDPEYGTGGGAVKLCSTSNAHLQSYHNLFCNCSTINGRNGGALLFQCWNGTVLMFRNCGHSCDAMYGAFITVIFESAEVNESTYLFCGRADNGQRWSTTSLNLGKVVFQNHNSSYNTIPEAGGGFGVASLHGLLARFTTCTCIKAANIMNSRQAKRAAYEREDMDYCNFLNNTLTDCIVRSNGNPVFYVQKCVFKNNDARSTVATDVVSESQGKLWIIDCHFDQRVTTNGTHIKFQTVSPIAGVTHRIEHLETQKCKADYPFPTEGFTDHVSDPYPSVGPVMCALFSQIVGMTSFLDE